MDLLHPNLLTNEQIVEILKERQLDIPNITGVGREELMRLYMNFIMPQPCRRTRDRSRLETGSATPEKEISNGELKRKHNRITFTEDRESKETQYKVKLPYKPQESDTRTTTPKRRTSSENSPPQNPHSKRKKITWP
uniref:Uncharacterized protein n=1 Tax=Phlebotomus kandelakii TaxID=1109342 RepID=A0A6B2EI88_9DIPT